MDLELLESLATAPRLFFSNHRESAYHGTNVDFSKQIVKDQEMVERRGGSKPLGPGIYFYTGSDEASGLDYAQGFAAKKHESPAVVMAVIRMKKCLDLISNQGNRLTLSELEAALEFAAVTHDMNVETRSCAFVLIRKFNRDLDGIKAFLIERHPLGGPQPATCVIDKTCISNVQLV